LETTVGKWGSKTGTRRQSVPGVSPSHLPLGELKYNFLENFGSQCNTYIVELFYLIGKELGQ
jgi:hypothetical protein